MIGENNLPSGSSYAYDDNTKGIINVGSMYYRLKMVQKDQSYTYSNVVSIQMPVETNFIVKGNPFKDRVKMALTSAQTENIQLRLYDESGKTIATRMITIRPGLNEFELDQLQSLAPGNYILELRTGKERFSTKVVKR